MTRRDQGAGLAGRAADHRVPPGGPRSFPPFPAWPPRDVRVVLDGVAG